MKPRHPPVPPVVEKALKQLRKEGTESATPPKAPVGRPPFPAINLPLPYVEKLEREAKKLARNPQKLKAWLRERRMFHILLQDHLSTAPIPGASGVQLNAASSKLFLEMTEPVVEALRGVKEGE